MASNHENKCTFISLTFKVEENKVPLFFYISFLSFCDLLFRSSFLSIFVPNGFCQIGIFFQEYPSAPCFFREEAESSRGKERSWDKVDKSRDLLDTRATESDERTMSRDEGSTRCRRGRESTENKERDRGVSADHKCQKRTDGQEESRRLMTEKDSNQTDIEGRDRPPQPQRITSKDRDNVIPRTQR